MNFRAAITEMELSEAVKQEGVPVLPPECILNHSYNMKGNYYDRG
jgi:hypothetical protein